MAGAANATAEAGLLKSLSQRHSVLVGIAILVIIGLAAIFAPFITPFDPGKLAIADRLKPPSGVHFFGTDEFGRDIFTRVLFAGRISMTVGISVAVLSSFFGVIFGLLAGFFRRLDAPISRIVDAMMAFPDILLAIALVAALGGSVFNVIIALTIVYTPRVARIVRASTLVIRELTYVEAARALGVSTWRILTNHVLRNIVSPLIVQATFVVAFAILAEASLSFLGAGVPQDVPTWGSMVSAGQARLQQAWWAAVFPGIFLFATVLAINLIGDALRDALDPRARDR